MSRASCLQIFDLTMAPDPDRPSLGRMTRFASGLIDYGVWWAVVFVTNGIVEDLLRSGFEMPAPVGDFNPRDGITVVSFVLGVVCGNSYFMLSNWGGRSLGKVILGFRLITTEVNPPARPGFVRAVLRSALTAPFLLGTVIALSGAHDDWAGTTIVRNSDGAVWWNFTFVARENVPSRRPPEMPAWKLVTAALVFAFSIIQSMLMAAI